MWPETGYTGMKGWEVNQTPEWWYRKWGRQLTAPAPRLEGHGRRWCDRKPGAGVAGTSCNHHAVPWESLRHGMDGGSHCWGHFLKRRDRRKNSFWLCLASRPPIPCEHLVLAQTAEQGPGKWSLRWGSPTKQGKERGRHRAGLTQGGLMQEACGTCWDRCTGGEKEGERRGNRERERDREREC